MARKKGQKGKYLGKRSFGKGNVKNKRGSGNRGGKGNAGMGKHKRTYIAKYAPNYFGKHGFANPTKKTIPVVHLYELNRKALLGKIEKKDGKFHTTFKGKVLATGKVTLPLKIEAYSWSKRVEDKLKQAGGEISKLQ